MMTHEEVKAPSVSRPDEPPPRTMTMMVWTRFRRHKLALYSTLTLVFMLILCYGLPIIASIFGWSPDLIDLYSRYEGMSLAHPFGTDELGRDVFLRLVYGGRISLSVGLVSALTAASIGTIIGLISGYYGGLIDGILMRFTDAMLSVPVLPLMIVFAALDLKALSQSSGAWGVVAAVSGLLFICVGLGTWLQNRTDGLHLVLINAVLAALVIGLPLSGMLLMLNSSSFGSGTMVSVIQLVIIVVFFSWMTVARLVRASALQLKELEYIDAAKMLGGSSNYIIRRHILPNAMAPIIVAATLEVGSVILYESILSFLGLGVKPPTASWGNMLRNALDYLNDSPLLAFWPGVFILITVVCVNFFGDGVRDALDPRSLQSGKGGH